MTEKEIKKYKRLSILFKGKNNPNYKDGKSYNNKCIDCGRKICYRAKRCVYCRQKINIIIKHHIDLNRNNNKKTNILFLLSGKHKSLHCRAYDYLVKIGLIKKYITYFKHNYMR
jgi:hypothetical protein